MVLVLASLTPPAAACEPSPLQFRTSQPAAGAVDVPLDVRAAVSFIGLGTADEFTVGLYRDDTEVPVAASTYCYEHEGPVEVHCWWVLRPSTLLAASTAYELRVRSTETWSGEGAVSMTAPFTTGTSEAPDVAGVPTLRVTHAWDEVATDSCQYPVARRYWLEVLPSGGVYDPSALSLFHIDALESDGSVRGRVHSTFVSNPGGGEVDTQLKQYLDAATSPSDCFRMVQEGPDGTTTAAVDACPEPPVDTGSADTGSDDTGSDDTGADDTGADDTGTADTGEGDSGGDTEKDAAPRRPPGFCAGCATGHGGPLGAGLVVTLGLVLVRSRRKDGAARAGPGDVSSVSPVSPVSTGSE